MAKMCPCPSRHHSIPHWKFLLRCYDKFPYIIIYHQETNKDSTNTCSTIYFRVYRNVLCCNVHGIPPYEEQTICYKCSTDISSMTPVKVYT